RISSNNRPRASTNYSIDSPLHVRPSTICVNMECALGYLESVTHATRGCVHLEVKRSSIDICVGARGNPKKVVRVRTIPHENIASVTLSAARGRDAASRRPLGVGRPSIWKVPVPRQN